MRLVKTFFFCLPEHTGLHSKPTYVIGFFWEKKRTCASVNVFHIDSMNSDVGRNTENEFGIKFKPL